MIWVAMAAAVLVGSVALYALLGGRRDERLAGVSTASLEVDSEQVRRVLGDGRVESLRWDEVREVEVLTRDVRDPAADGVSLVLVVDETRGCVLPSRLAAEHGVIERLHLLPGFDTRALATAMEQASPSRTTCWRRSVS